MKSQEGRIVVLSQAANEINMNFKKCACGEWPLYEHIKEVFYEDGEYIKPVEYLSVKCVKGKDCPKRITGEIRGKTEELVLDKWNRMVSDEGRREDWLSRRGSFAVHLHLLQKQPWMVAAIMKHMIIMDARANMMNNTIEYTAYSLLFDVCAVNEERAKYVLDIKNGKLPDDFIIKARRKNQ